MGVEIIPNDQGNRITPSYVAFIDNGQRLVGDSAKNRATLDPTNVVFDIKRLIGRRMDDPFVIEDAKLLPYNIVKGEKNGNMNNDDHRPYVIVHATTDERRLYAPEEISAMILAKLKSDAEKYLGKEIHRAVITVPAYFNDAQRHATRDAGLIAGLIVERIINEPTAAAISYGVGRQKTNKDNKHEEEEEEQNVLVFDLGGGTFDVTLLSIDNGIFEVLATNGDTHLGGSDIDRNLMEYCLTLIRKRDGHRDVVSTDKRALQKLRTEVERVKRALSSQLQARIDIEDLVPGYDFTETITRAKFEEINEALFRRTLDPVRKVMEDANLIIDDVHRIILVGGSTRIPRVQEIVKEYFGGREPDKGINPDESVAVGAAIQGSVLSGDGGEDVKDLMLLDVTPLSLGTEADGGLMSVIIKRGTTIPTQSSHIYHTTKDNQRIMVIDVYEGERSRTKDNHLLGLFEMKDLPPAPRGSIEMKITFKVDANGLLEVTAENLATKSTKGIIITSEDGRLSHKEMDDMVKEAEKYADKDRKEALRISSRNMLESLLYTLTSTLKESSSQSMGDASKDDLQTLSDSVDEMIEWLDGNQNASESEYSTKYAEIDSLSRPMLQQLYEARRGGGDDYDDFGVDDEL
jgi:heat shock protein 5